MAGVPGSVSYLPCTFLNSTSPATVKPRIQTVSSRFSEAWSFVMLAVSWGWYWSEPGLASCSAVTDADRVMDVIHRHKAAARYLNFM